MDRSMIITVIAMLLLGIAQPAWSDHEHQHSETVSTSPAQPTLQLNQMAVDVHGMVCSICAYGLEKRLDKLNFLDRTQFKNGTLVDIYNHTVTLALSPGHPIDVKQVHNAIMQGGYKPVIFFVKVWGVVERQDNEYVLRRKTGELFQLSGEGADPLEM